MIDWQEMEETAQEADGQLPPMDVSEAQQMEARGWLWDFERAVMYKMEDTYELMYLNPKSR